MKSFIKIAFAITLFISSNAAMAQKLETGCIDPDIKGQADGLKASYVKEGYSLFQEAMIHMTSLEAAPIEVKLMQGVSYQFIFVASDHANKMNMEIFDGSDKKIDQKMERGGNNFIIYPFTPTKTDVYLITLMQKKGTRDMCGYFGVMIKSDNKTLYKYQPAPRQVEKPVNKMETQPAAAKPLPQKTENNKTKNYKVLPANQRPNPNRVKATNEALEEKN